MNDQSEPLTDPEIKKTPLTQKQVEDFIMLAGQREERWFKMSFVDAQMNDDPTAVALMEALSDVIYDGIISMALEERVAQAKEDVKGVNNNGTH